MRCVVSNPKTLRKLSRATGLNVKQALVRGGTGHRYILWFLDESGEIKPAYYYPDGRLYIGTPFDYKEPAEIIVKSLHKKKARAEALALYLALIGTNYRTR